MANWHAANSLVIVTEINQLQISSGMPISSTNTLAACQWPLDVYCSWHTAKNDNEI
jgi:hypothetical protein